MAARDVPAGHPVATMVNAAAGASKEDDIQKMLKCATHLGTKNCDVLMEPYVFKRRVDGTFCGSWGGLVRVVCELMRPARSCDRWSLLRRVVGRRVTLCAAVVAGLCGRPAVAACDGQLLLRAVIHLPSVGPPVRCASAACHLATGY